MRHLNDFIKTFAIAEELEDFERRKTANSFVIATARVLLKPFSINFVAIDEVADSSMPTFLAYA